jgi:hypothetical protein
MLPIQLNKFAPRGSDGKLGTVLRKEVFKGSKYARAEYTNEWYLVENETEELMDARSMLPNPLVYDTVHEVAEVLRKFLRPDEVQPMDDDK